MFFLPSLQHMETLLLPEAKKHTGTRLGSSGSSSDRHSDCLEKRTVRWPLLVPKIT